MLPFSFGAVIVLGNHQSWISDLQAHLESSVESMITNPTYQKMRMTIYSSSGIDFIFPEVNLDDYPEVVRGTTKINKFMKERYYLEHHTLFFMKYMSPKFRQILDCLNNAELNPRIVSLKPNRSKDLFYEVCMTNNFRFNIHSNLVLDKMVINRILSDIFEEETLNNLFKKDIEEEVFEKIKL